MKLPDSPKDRAARDQALAHVAKRLAVAALPLLLVGLLAHALGVPWFLVLAAFVFLVYLVLFET